MESLALVLVALCASPFLSQWVASRALRNTRREEWKRQDDVADKAAAAAAHAADAAVAAREAAVVVKDQAAEAARLLLESHALDEANRREARESRQELSAKLDGIHTLVNSSMTAVIQYALDSTLRELALLQENAEMRGPNDVSSDAIARARQSIEELTAALSVRSAAASAAEAGTEAATGKSTKELFNAPPTGQ